ncbi:MAG: GIY-YIG nuclease family protein [Methanomassiliicoccales archaeon]|jgi:Uri superfamily endonuclease
MDERERLASPGAYVLVVELERDAMLVIGRLGESSFPSGTYAYVGSAMGGLGGRLGRHLNPERKTHWHIDHLSRTGEIVGAFVVPSRLRQECAVSKTLAGIDRSIPFCFGFGCSDCECQTHLFQVDEDALEELRRRYGEMLPSYDLKRQSSRR